MRRSSRATRRIVAAIRFRCRAARVVASSLRWGTSCRLLWRITPLSYYRAEGSSATASSDRAIEHDSIRRRTLRLGILIAWVLKDRPLAFREMQLLGLREPPCNLVHRSTDDERR